MLLGYPPVDSIARGAVIFIQDTLNKLRQP